jgi:hypothetical protein
MSVRFLSGVNVDSNTLVVDDVNNRVGIGTASPTAPFNVFSSSVVIVSKFENNATAIQLNIGDSSNTLYSNIFLETNSGQGEIFKAGSAYSAYGGASALNIYNSNGPIAFHPNNTANAMLIANTGNVGIGTTSPAYKLEVQGNARFADINQAFGSIEVGGYYSPSSTYWTAKIVGDYYGEQYNPSVLHGLSFIGGRSGFDNFRFFDSSYNELFTIRYTGNVGIGTTSPSEILHINSTTDPTILISNGGGTSPFPRLTLYRQAGVSADIFYDAANKNLTFQNDYTTVDTAGNIYFNTRGSNTRLIVTGAGNVGIGTTSPSEKLVVNGNTILGANNITTISAYINKLVTPTYYVDGAGNGFSIATTGVTIDEGPALLLNGRSFTLGSYDNARTFAGIRVTHVNNTTTSDLVEIISGDAVRMVISGSGNVGIGTTTPAHKLDINGGAFADYYQLDTTYSNGNVQGRISWDPDNNTAAIGLDPDVNLRIGQDDMWFVKNQTGASIPKGTLVYASGTVGASGRILIAPYIANGTIEGRFILGVTAEAIANGADGYVIAKGKLRGVNTSAYTAGTVLWASAATAGALTSTEPTAPNVKAAIAFVVYQDAANGILAVRRDSGTKLFDATDVNISSASTGQLLRYNSNRWENWTPNFLTAEADTLDSVTDRGNTTTNAITVGGLTVDTTTLVVDSANDRVGIGTSSPGHKLDVRGGNIKTDKALISQGANVSWTGAATFMDWQAGLVFGRVGAYDYGASTWRPLSINDGSIYITGSNGNVGIGTTSPSSKLSVEGATSIYSSVAGNFTSLSLQNTSTSSTARNILQFSNNVGAVGLIDVFGGNWSPTGGGDDVANGFRILGLSDGGLSLRASTSTIRFYTGSSERMRITAAGNVGIGTTSPSYKLHVNGDTFFNGSSIVSGNAQVLTINGTNHAYYAWSIANTRKAYAGFGSSGSTTFELINENTGGFIIGTNGGQQIIITSAGNVGIGTTSPARKLQVEVGSTAQGGQNWSHSNGTVFARLGIVNPGVNNNTEFGSASNNDLVLLTVNAERMRITAAGNVGIGATSPAEKLEVAGNIKSNAGNGEGFVLNGGLAIHRLSGTELGFITSSTERMRITSAGNVGIGTTAPGYKLEVNGDVGGSPVNIARFTAGIAGGGTRGMNLYSDGTQFKLQVNDNVGNTGDWAFLNLNPDGGFVGVGNTSPSQKLHVTGNVRVTGAYYDSNNEAGTSGQVLTSTGSGTDWVTPATTTASSLYDLLPAARVAYNWTGQVVNNTWVDIFTAADNVLTTGTWMVQMYISDFAVGGGHYTYTYTGTMQWYQDGVNQDGESAASEIYLHRMGHAANTSALYLRTTETRAAGGNIGKLQIKGNYSNTANTTINFKFVKIF